MGDEGMVTMDETHANIVPSGEFTTRVSERHIWALQSPTPWVNHQAATSLITRSMFLDHWVVVMGLYAVAVSAVDQVIRHCWVACSAE